MGEVQEDPKEILFAATAAANTLQGIGRFVDAAAKRIALPPVATARAVCALARIIGVAGGTHTQGASASRAIRAAATPKRLAFLATVRDRLLVQCLRACHRRGWPSALVPLRLLNAAGLFEDVAKGSRVFTRERGLARLLVLFIAAAGGGGGEDGSADATELQELVIKIVGNLVFSSPECRLHLRQLVANTRVAPVLWQALGLGVTTSSTEEALPVSWAGKRLPARTPPSKLRRLVHPSRPAAAAAAAAAATASLSMAELYPELTVVDVTNHSIRDRHGEAAAGGGAEELTEPSAMAEAQSAVPQLTQAAGGGGSGGGGIDPATVAGPKRFVEWFNERRQATARSALLDSLRPHVQSQVVGKDRDMAERSAARERALLAEHEAATARVTSGNATKVQALERRCNALFAVAVGRDAARRAALQEWRLRAARVGNAAWKRLLRRM